MMAVWPDSSVVSPLSVTETSRFTVRSHAGAAFAVSVKLAAVPSVTGLAPAAIVMDGGGVSSSRSSTLAEDGSATR